MKTIIIYIGYSIPVENIELLGSEIFGAEIAGKNMATLDNRIPNL